MNTNSFLPTPEYLKITGCAIVVMATMLVAAIIWHCFGA